MFRTGDELIEQLQVCPLSPLGPFVTTTFVTNKAEAVTAG